MLCFDSSFREVLNSWNNASLNTKIIKLRTGCLEKTFIYKHIIIGLTANTHW